jgi:hypothetical protein
MRSAVAHFALMVNSLFAADPVSMHIS